ncbi:hypothetical protein J2T09_003260 [Neorhizobium huautlense]|uniref:Uncharacterized protein n=1 Tax=Neorhizobium huautlense TaxID=67774 RepID=A0ABT9PVK6_9HYPH|nr:hypothetical protein [Neorhizobium huautlense]
MRNAHRVQSDLPLVILTSRIRLPGPSPRLPGPSPRHPGLEPGSSSAASAASKTHAQLPRRESSLTAQTRGGRIPAVTPMSQIDHVAPIALFPENSSKRNQRLVKKLNPTSSTLPKPVPTILPFHRGYTGRRPGELEPALVLEKRRKSPATGFAETGSPPATRGRCCGHQTSQCL